MKIYLKSMKTFKSKLFYINNGAVQGDGDICWFITVLFYYPKEPKDNHFINLILDRTEYKCIFS